MVSADDKRDFVKSLIFLAKECGKELTKIHFELYDRAVQGVGYDEARKAIEHFLLNRRERDPFPSPRELVSAAVMADGEPSDPHEIVSKMVGAISKFGYPNSDDARKYVGEIGWEIIQREGGWVRFCTETKTDQLPFLRSQWRKAVEQRIEDRAEQIVRRALGLELTGKMLQGRGTPPADPIEQ